MTACALVIVENNLRSSSNERASRPHTPNTPSTPRTPNGLLQNLPSWTVGNDEVAWTTFRDMAAVVAIVCMLVSLSFESFKTWQWTYRDPTGPVDPEKPPLKSRVLDYEWNSEDDFWGVIIECAKAALMLLLVCALFFTSKRELGWVEYHGPPLSYSMYSMACQRILTITINSNLPLAKLLIYSMRPANPSTRWAHCIRDLLSSSHPSVFETSVFDTLRPLH
jgi:hypothetical protein